VKVEQDRIEHSLPSELFSTKQNSRAMRTVINQKRNPDKLRRNPW